MEEFASLTMDAMETGKRHFSYHSNSCLEEKMLHQKH